eukprot:9359185-Lingulodinium_polyedra.AAC.1
MPTRTSSKPGTKGRPVSPTPCYGSLLAGEPSSFTPKPSSSRREVRRFPSHACLVPRRLATLARVARAPFGPR